MSKNYVYRMDHDTGRAPNISHGICVLTGCKKTTIELWANKGSWVIGIGGKKTGRPDKLIYAMEVEYNLSYSEFKAKYPDKTEDLPQEPGTNVLLSTKFYYFGDKAIDIPKGLRHIVIDRQGCKRVSDETINALKKHLAAKGYCRYGKFGKPNNPEVDNKCAKC